MAELAVVVVVGACVVALVFLLVRRFTVPDNENVARKWQARILSDCTDILGRRLTETETTFVTSRHGFIALEVIDDTVRSFRGRPAELERYLRSES